MLSRVFQLSDITLFFLLTVVLTLVSLVCIYLVKKNLHVELKSKNNTVIGNISSLISIIYGVLVGLMALFLLNNVSSTADAVLREANALADIYRDTKWLQDPARNNIQVQIKNYIIKVIDVEWPLMQKGEFIDSRGAALIENITNELVHYNTNTASEGLLIHDMLDEIKILYDARQQRIQMSYSQLNTEIWIVIIIGTLLIIFINYFYAINYMLHAIMISSVALMSSSMIFLLVTLDRPFQGEFVIEPNQFWMLLNAMEGKSGIIPKANTLVDHK